jgi:hypothetical protein
VLVLAGAVGGGVAIGMALDDEPAAESITEAEHDRLVDACVAETDDHPLCVDWVAGVVEQANADGVGYVELTEMLAEEYEQDRREADARESERLRQEREGMLRWICDLADDTGLPPEPDPACDSLD